MTNPSGTVRVHGTPGQSLREGGARMYGAATASRGSFIEQATARALEHWLSRRPDCAGLHLFHDLGGFRDVAGHGLPPVSLGTVNIDHVILTGARWLLVDAKGTAAGTLTTDSAGKGVLIQADGSRRPEPWLDITKTRSAAGVLVRLTGLRGWPVWVVPDATKHDPEILKARAFRPGGAICTISDVYGGSLDEVARAAAASRPGGRGCARAVSHSAACFCCGDPGVILGTMDAGNLAWVPGEDERGVDAAHTTATALRMMDHSILVWPEAPELGAQLAADAGAVFGGGVLLALQDMQAEGRLPAPGTPAWDDFVAAAEAGDVELAIVVLVRDREPVCEDRVARRFGKADPPPAGPVNLADELRAMGLM